MDSLYFKNLLRERNLKATIPRMDLLRHMQGYKSAMPYTAIQKAMQSIDRVTLYRSLETLIKQGIIHKAFQEKNETYYAICKKECSADHHEHDHIHFKCETCQSVTCEQLSQTIKISIPDYEVHQINVYINGICKTCKETNLS